MAAERKIGGHVYRAEKLPAEEGLELYLDLNEVFGGSDVMLGAILEPLDRQKHLAAFVQIAADLSLNKERVGAFLKRAVELCRVGSDPCVLGVKPAEMPEAIEVMFFSLQAQFRDFLSESLPKVVPKGQPGASS